MKRTRNDTVPVIHWKSGALPGPVLRLLPAGDAPDHFLPVQPGAVAGRFLLVPAAALYPAQDRFGLCPVFGADDDGRRGRRHFPGAVSFFPLEGGSSGALPCRRTCYAGALPHIGLEDGTAHPERGSRQDGRLHAGSAGRGDVLFQLGPEGGDEPERPPGESRHLHA